jgi:tetratricopeptide (TPR) repeat protein
MSRLYITFFICLPFLVYSQKTRQLVKFADEQYKKGDYYYALEYYKQALGKDSSNLEILWKYAEALRAYKNYSEAEKQYAKVFAREQAKVYPSSILQLGLMQKQTGNYKKAIESFKLAARLYEKDKTNYLYKKVDKEIQSTQWAISHYSDTIKPMDKLPLTVNSFDAEFGHSVRDNQLIFSSLRADSIVEQAQEVYARSYKTKLYKAEIKNGEFLKNERIDTLSFETLNSGNGSFSLDGKFFYFSLCEDEGYNYKCKIARASYLGNGKWGKIDTLSKQINADGKNTTMPYIGNVDGKEVLFFASDRQGTKGSLDIWFALKNGENFESPINLSVLNTEDGEVTPWYDEKEKRLYFSSSWHNGFGGADVFYSTVEWKNNTLLAGEVMNAGLPINSPANDLYYFKHKDTVYVSSNRIGSYFSKNPTCCSDIFASYPLPINELLVIIDTPIIQEKIRKKLPVVLYFQNDEPDAKTTATTTKLNYLTTYSVYKSNYPVYKKEVSNGVSGALAKKRVDDLSEFFQNNVDKGVSDLEEFKSLILEELKLGSNVILTVKGFASPLAKTDYNVNLTKRRISSLINYFKETNKGEFIPYINGKALSGGKLSFVYAPFGEFSADQQTSDNFYDQKNSVYSKEASVERKIHIEEVVFERNEAIFPLTTKESVFTAGVKKQGDLMKGSHKIKNNSNQVISFQVNNSNAALKITSSKTTLNPGEEITLSFELKSDAIKGFKRISYSLGVTGFKNQLELFLTTEVK